MSIPDPTAGTSIVIVPQVVQPPFNAPVSVKAVQFGILSASDIHQLSVLPCRRVVGPVQDFGVNDSRLGTCDRFSKCGTCGLGSEACAGHSGHVNLELPVFHAGFILHAIRICRTICKTCSRVLLEPEEVEYFTRQLSHPMEGQQRLALIKRIQEDAYKTHVCIHCGAINGEVKRGRPMRIIHDKYGVHLRRSEQMDCFGTSGSAHVELQESLSSAEAQNKELRGRCRKIVEILDPIRVRDLFSRILPSEMPLLGFQPGLSSPIDTLVSCLVVPPVCVRPSGGGGISQPREDDITAQLNDIIICSDMLRDGANDVTKYAETWDLLQTRVARVLDSQMPGFPAALRSADTKSYAQRIKGKHGRFRGNLSGKRVDFSGRSVISPDPNLDVDELAVPLSVARTMTYPQRVYQHNLEFMRRLVANGPSVHPGAVTVYLASERSRRWLRNPSDRSTLAARLSVGDVVERHIINGDMIIFNRQPSLHRISMMAHRARVLPYRTFRFNVCSCAPYNADFDGDEMNVHLVQTEEARAETAELMLSAKNIITAKNGEPIIACTQDFLTASYLVTSKECFFDRSQFTEMVSHWLGPKTMFDLPYPALLRPTELWTGKQLFSLILRPSHSEKVYLNLQLKARGYSGSDEHWDKNEGFVSMLDSMLISGRLDKKVLGGGAKDGLFARLFALADGDYTARCMSRISFFTSRYLQDYGFSLGLSDVSPTETLEEEKQKAMKTCFAECDRLIQEAANGSLVPIPGMSLKESLEAMLNSELSLVRNTCGSIAVKTLNKHSNVPLIMVNSGSKGSELNTAQMMACVGQQTVNGKRIVNAFDDRSLPHFHRFAEYPAARGFVASSFYSGLSPTEFFFHTMAGREGLVDTAVKTAETGYLYRRLSKALENVTVRYDFTVRNARNEVVQFRYGEDGMDPWQMEGSNGAPLNLSLEWLDCRSAYARQQQSRQAPTGQQSMRKNQETSPQVKLEGLHEERFDQGSSIPSSTALPFVESLDEQRWYVLSLLPHEIVAYVEGALDGKESILEEADKWYRKEHAESTSLDSSPTRGRSLNPSCETVASKWLRRMRSRKGFCRSFKEAMKNFFEKKVKEQLRLRVLFQLPMNEYACRRTEVKEEVFDEEHSAEYAHRLSIDVYIESLLSELLPLTPSMLFFFLEHCAEKYGRKICEPGTPCGSIAAQSVGEPSTQMTLRTFHFAGVASMNITQGVPRLKELINANANISTPVITVPVSISMHEDTSRTATSHLLSISPITRKKLEEEACLSVKGLVERVCLKHVTLEMVEVLSSSCYYLQIRLNMPLIERCLLPIDAFTVRQQILKFASKPLSPLRLLKEEHVQVISRDALHIYPFYQGKAMMLFNVKQLLTILPDVVVNGIHGMNRVMVSSTAAQLLAEGTELKKVMSLPHVDGHRCRCNHVAVIERTLGIEAARQTIVDEISNIMKAYSLNIDIRHIYLLADLMTHRGVVLGITRYGLQKMNNSVLTMASFERTTEHLYNAAIIQRKDQQLDVSDSVMVGKPIQCGTNSFRVLMDQGRCCGGPLVGSTSKDATTASTGNPLGASPSSFVPVTGKLARAENFDQWSRYARHAYPATASIFSKPLAAENAFNVDIFV